MKEVLGGRRSQEEVLPKCSSGGQHLPKRKKAFPDIRSHCVGWKLLQELVVAVSEEMVCSGQDPKLRT